MALIKKNYLIQLTNNLYRLTLLFPKKEPLRYKMRELADEILANLTPLSQNPQGLHQSKKSTIVEISDRGLRDIEILDSFFEVAKNQNWVSPSDVLEIQKEYSNIKEGLKKILAERKEALPKTRELGEVKPPAIRISASHRHQKILEILKEKGKAQVWELKKIFPEVTKRTLRRDFEQMLNQGLIERIGERNNTFYQLKNRTYNEGGT